MYFVNFILFICVHLHFVNFILFIYVHLHNYYSHSLNVNWCVYAYIVWLILIVLEKCLLHILKKRILKKKISIYFIKILSIDRKLKTWCVKKRQEKNIISTLYLAELFFNKIFYITPIYILFRKSTGIPKNKSYIC